MRPLGCAVQQSGNYGSGLEDTGVAEIDEFTLFGPKGFVHHVPGGLVVGIDFHHRFRT